jgi:cation diffusion facilitator family transporter
MDRSRSRSTATVVLAGGVNLVIAVGKLVAGLLSGSTAMLSESAHSFADTVNQAFLMTALRRSSRPADRRHPFGYGKERYFWALLAAVAVFVLGAGFSVLEGVSGLVSAPTQGDPAIAFAVLGVAFLLDGSSLTRAAWQLRREAREHQVSLRDQLLVVAEPTVRAVFFEDLAAVIGVLLAALGLGLDLATGMHAWDPVASLLIALLLVGVAFVLGRQNQDLLIGRAAPPAMLRDMQQEIGDTEGITEVVELLTMQLGPEDVLLAARVSVEPGEEGREIEQVADVVDERVRARFPAVRHVFLDPTPRR